MKTLVPVKRVIDDKVTVRVKPDGSGVDLANVKMSKTLFDEYPVEQAIRLKEAGIATEVAGGKPSGTREVDGGLLANTLSAYCHLLGLPDRPISLEHQDPT